MPNALVQPLAVVVVAFDAVVAEVAMPRVLFRLETTLCTNQVEVYPVDEILGLLRMNFTSYARSSSNGET